RRTFAPSVLTELAAQFPGVGHPFGAQRVDGGLVLARTPRRNPFVRVVRGRTDAADGAVYLVRTPARNNFQLFAGTYSELKQKENHAVRFTQMRRFLLVRDV